MQDFFFVFERSQIADYWSLHDLKHFVQQQFIVSLVFKLFEHLLSAYLRSDRYLVFGLEVFRLLVLNKGFCAEDAFH